MPPATWYGRRIQPPLTIQRRMEAARPPRPRRRPRPGTVDRPLDVRLVRVAALVVVPAVLALLFSISATGTLPRPTLEPIFDPGSAAAFAEQLSTEFPSRVPGTEGSGGAALWYSQTVASLGFRTEEDVWSEDLADLGRVELRNVVAVVPGRSEEAVVVVAHRDNAGAAELQGDNASGTAALIELARGFAPSGAAAPPQPQRTLVLVSTDAGAYGGAGARRFAASSEHADRALAVVVLDGIGRRGRPRIAISGDEPRSPARALVSTASARIAERVQVTPAIPSVLTQLVDLAIPFGSGEQAPFLARGIAAITITTEEPGDPEVPAGDTSGSLATERFGQLGRATEALLGSIDISVGSAFRTPDSLFLEGRAASGWAVRLTLVVAVVPFVLGVLDLLARSRRRELPFRPALRALRSRLVFWLYGGVLLALAGLTGILPTGADLALPTHTSVVEDVNVAGLILVGIALVSGWLAGRRHLVPARGATAEERLAGYAVALGWLGVLAVVIALVKPYALVFVLPSLYAWLWLPLHAKVRARGALYVLGLAGPVVTLVVLSAELGLGLVETPLYLAGLATVGYVSVGAVLLAVAWAAPAGQLAALAFGRYAPYAGGAEPPPPGLLRASAARLESVARSRRYARPR